MTNSTTFLPQQIGIASDLLFIVNDAPGYLANCLLVHDELVIPINADLLRNLEAKFGSEGLYTLVKEGRVRFCPAISISARNSDFEYSEDIFFNNLRDQDSFKGEADRDNLFDAIRQTFVRSNASDYKKWMEIANDAEEAMIETGSRRGYEWLFEGRNPLTGKIERSRERLVGLITGIARMNDLRAVGIESMEMDSELPMLLEIGFPVISTKKINDEAMKERSKTVIERLHKIDGLPCFASQNHVGLRSEENISYLIKTILSDEAADLRKWLRENIGPDLDVRSAYEASERLLPSKNKWTNWMRFGMSSGVGAAMGALATAHPIGAAVAGVAVGAADLAWGEATASKIVDPYHPKQWLSHMRRDGER